MSSKSPKKQKKRKKVKKKQYKPKWDGQQTPPKRSNLYAQISRHVPQAIEELLKLLKSKNEPVRLGAIKTILNKTIPDIKVQEIKGEEGQPLGVVILPKVHENKPKKRNMEAPSRPSNRSTKKK